MGVLSRLAWLALLLTSTPALAQDGAVLEFHGACDASAAIALDENRIIVGDDENPWLSIYRLDDRRLEDRIVLPFGLAAPVAPGREAAAVELDIEAATILNGRILWATSHARNKSGKARPDRAQLFASHRLAPDGTWAGPMISVPFRGLLAAIGQTADPAYAPLKRAIGDATKTTVELAPKKKGLNIEGMAAARDGRGLLIGLRNPLLDGRAIVFRVEHVDEVLDGVLPTVTLGPLVTLDLGGRGIRDMAWSAALDTYLIVGGQPNDEGPGPGFAIFSWPGAGPATVVDAFGDLNRNPAHFHPEAIVPLPERQAGRLVPSANVLLISDDGTRPVAGGVPCKLAPPGDRSFRGIVRSLK